VRQICIDAILHTDNTLHSTIVQGLKMFGEMNEELLNRAQSKIINGAASEWPTQELVDRVWELEVRKLLRNSALHLADISNPMKPFEICKMWAQCILEEFFSLGDKMSELGLPVPALNDRGKTNRPHSQIGFIEFFVAPMVFATVRVLAPLHCLEEEMLQNSASWLEEWAASTGPPEAELEAMSKRGKTLRDKANFQKALPAKATGRWAAFSVIPRKTLQAARTHGSPVDREEGISAESDSPALVRSMP
ncbi:unnamed protein product, partial [Polarella glacialis]